MQKTKQDNHRTYSLPAPHQGLNTVDALNALNEFEALELLNLYPDDGIVKLRDGFTEHTTANLNVPVKTLASLNLADGTHEFLLSAGGNVYKYTLLGSRPTPDNIGSSTNDEWQTVTYNYKLFAVNGEDTPFYWDGTSSSYTTLTFTGTGLTLSDLVNVSVYKERLYFVEKNTGNIWYSGVKNITGTLTKFDADFIMRDGGFVVMCGNYTNNYASQVDDLFYILTSEGELLFYSGDDPSDANWQIVARYSIGRPLGYRAVVKVENDTIFITDRGLTPCSALFAGTPTTAQETIGRKINKLIRTQAKDLPFSYLWDGKFWANGSRFYITLPQTDNVEKLLVCNINTGAWTTYKYNGENSGLGKWHSFSIHDGHPYAGSEDGLTAKLEDGQQDIGAISYELQYGFNYFGNKQSYKRFTEIRPLLKTASGIDITVQMLTDYREFENPVTITTSGTYTPWGSPWGSLWSSPVETRYDRSAISGSGHSGALKITGTVTNVPLEFYAIELTIEDGARR